MTGWWCPPMAISSSTTATPWTAFPFPMEAPSFPSKMTQTMSSTAWLTATRVPRPSPNTNSPPPACPTAPTPMTTQPTSTPMNPPPWALLTTALPRPWVPPPSPSTRWMPPPAPRSSNSITAAPAMWTSPAGASRWMIPTTSRPAPPSPQEGSGCWRKPPSPNTLTWTTAGTMYISSTKPWNGWIKSAGIPQRVAPGTVCPMAKARTTAGTSPTSP